MLSLAILALLCALLPFALFARNQALYQVPPPSTAAGVGISVLIPARNEEGNIAAALESVLASRDALLEVIVLDDASTDGTSDVVRGFAARDERVRLAAAPPLPSGWIGKMHACAHLATLAAYPHLLFLDADVRLTPDALCRFQALLAGAELWSGVPRQITGSFSERLLIPFIHFVLLGYLPLARMRATHDPALGAGCGQMILTTREAYRRTGGHAALPGSLHDGLHLARLYRAAGLRTDLTDITPLATCHMYSGNAATWQGLARNGHQGMGTWGAIFPMSFLLLAGQVLPFLLLLCSDFLSARLVAGVAVALAWGTRGWMAVRFRQGWLGVLLHPVGVLGLLGLQWWARGRHSLGWGSRWKGRVCDGA